MDPLLVRIFDVDFYMSSPIPNLDITFSQFRGSATHQVPVIRVFGSTDVGKKICVHVHGVFPYFYIPYDGTEAANGLMYKIASNLDKAINISLGQTSSNNHHIYKIVLVSGIPFYGYHSRKHQFFKVYLYNPMLLKRVNNLLFNESILGKLYQPHETHLNFTLQFMIDYNLHGMSNIVLSQVEYRHAVGENEYSIDDPSKVSSCELECDTLGEHILNRKEVESGNLAANPGIAALWEDERQRRRNKNEDSQLPHYLSLSRTNVPPTITHEFHKNLLQGRLAVLDQDMEKNDFNLSVYPAECQQDENLLNCSIVDFHSPLTSQEEISFDSELDQTIMNETLNITLDQDIQDLVDVLRDLEKNVVEEEDSILSQIPKNEEVEEDQDMKISTESCEDMFNETIKCSQIPKDNEIEKEVENVKENVDQENKGPSIPQLDGNCSDFGADTEAKPNKNNDFKYGMFSSFKVDVGLKIPHHSIRIHQKDGNKESKDIHSYKIHQPVDVIPNTPDTKESPKNTEDEMQQGCYLKHIFPHVEKTFEQQLYNPRVMAFVAENKKIIQSMIDKKYPYFRAPSIGERVALKNQVKRNKLMLKNMLESLCELVVVTEKLDIPEVSKKKRDMPSLSSSDSSYEPPTVWKPLRKSKSKKSKKKKRKKSDKVKGKKKQSTVKKNLDRNLHVRNLLVDELNKEHKTCLESLQKGAKPIFKIVPGYRPYTYDPLKIKIEIKRLDELSSSNIYKEQNNNGEDVDQTVMKQTNSPFKEKETKNEKNSNKDDNNNSNDSNFHKEFVKRSILEIFRAQKQNEALFFSSMNSIMEHYSISENKLLENSKSVMNKTKGLQFLDGAFDDSDEDDKEKRKSRSSRKKIKSVYSSLPVYTTSSAGKSVSIATKSDPEKKNEDEIRRKEHYENLKHIRRKINFDSTSHKEPDETDKLIDSPIIKSTSFQTHRNKDDAQNTEIIKTEEVEQSTEPIKTKSSSSVDEHEKETQNSETTKALTASDTTQKETCTEIYHQVEQKEKGTKKFESSSSDSNQNEPVEENIENFSFINQKETGNNNLTTKEQSDQLYFDLKAELTERTRTFFSIFQQTVQKLENLGDGRTIPDLSDILLMSQQEGLMPTDTDTSDPHGYATPILDKDGNISQSFIDEAQRTLMEHKLSASEIYDITNNYFPQPSTSKVVDPVPQNNNEEEELDDAWLSSPEDYNKALPVGLEDAVIPSSGSGVPGRKGVTLRPTVYDDNGFVEPIYKPPTRKDVIQTMPEYGIPMLRPQEPFYSNVEDATGAMEVGYNILKVKTKTSRDVEDFQSKFGGLEDVRKKYYPLDLSGGKTNPKYLYCGQGYCIVKPLINTPTYKEVEEWFQKNSEPTKKVEKAITKKSKVYFASSQDAFSDNDMSMDLTLTLSPTTSKPDTTITDSQESTATSLGSLPKEEINLLSPISSPGLNENRASDSEGNMTPRSSRSRESRGNSPVLGASRGRKRFDRSMVLRKSALLSQSSEHSGIISGVSLNNTYGFQCSVQNYQKARASVKYEYLTILSMELHVDTRGDLKPNPQYDQIQAIFYSISNDVEENTVKPRRTSGVFAVNPKETLSFLDGSRISCDIKYVQDELELFQEFSKFVIHWDPDILLGYEIQMLSWGYLIERCYHLGINIIPEISRVKDKHLKFNEKETGDLRITGRVVLDLWRLLRHEIALQSYTIQSTVYEILQKRIPMYSFKDLTTWWSHQSSFYKHRTANYYMTCVNSQLKILEQLDFVGRTSELARLFGIQFYEVLSRGSQFRVESMMLRLAKPMNYVAVSPSVQQRAKMRAPEHIALVLEPESKLYTDPVIVLDFQSLYPSIIIAYNYCFSTCAGRVDLMGKNAPFEFGATNLKVTKERIKHLLRRDLLNFSPCGVAFVKKSVRDGIMPRMLREILDTRLMVKKSMKENKDDSVLQKVLHSRQLGLKLIANVTYGYTAANFSGRMPSVELGDSIVSKARETLQRAISLVDSNKKWGARVVYGDTDSLFVLCPGKTRAEAFAIGEQIVQAVGKENPDPIKLKLEKVYQPCILQTKKRYVGYMYESPDQKEPTYDAKGIETVRRDGCPAVSKMLEKTLRILFETKDVSKVKQYCVKQFNKIVMGRISIKDLTFAKEFRGFTGYRPGACVPSLELAKKWVAVDKRAEPRRGERVPYVIVNGPPGLPLIRLVRSPYELLKDPALRPNALYYITRVIIPPLNRCFNLIGVDLHHWFAQMPRKHLQYLPTSTSPTKKSTISQYFISTLCAVCGVQAQSGLCEKCVEKKQQTVTILNERVRKWETAYYNCKLICSTCTQIPEEPTCISLDCPVLYRLNQTNRDLQQADHIRHLLSQYFDIF